MDCGRTGRHPVVDQFAELSVQNRAAMRRLTMEKGGQNTARYYFLPDMKVEFPFFGRCPQERQI